MFERNERQFDSIDYRLVRIVGGLFIIVFLVAICFLSAWLGQPKETSPSVQQAPPALLPPTALPVKHYSTYLPVALTAPASEPENIWEVAKIDNLGYALQGQRYDMATFIRIDGQLMVQGYCINRGWDVPVIGARYWLDGDTFVPIREPAGDPFQRFMKIDSILK